MHYTLYTFCKQLGEGNSLTINERYILNHSRNIFIELAIYHNINKHFVTLFYCLSIIFIDLQRELLVYIILLL